MSNSSEKSNEQPNQRSSNVRWILLAIVFVASLIAYLDRVNLSICAGQIMEEMGLTRVQLGASMSAFFIAYAIMQIPGGIMAERWGIRKTSTLALVWWSLFTILTPLAWGYVSFVLIRMLVGLGQAPFYPSNGAFFSNWFSSKEKAFPSSLMLVGTFLGSAMGPPITVIVVGLAGWKWAFYSYGIIGLVIGVVWYIYSRNTPHEHSGVNEVELLNITEQTSVNAIKEKTAKPKAQAPWGKFIRSPRFWAFGSCYFANNYMMYLFLSWIPLYLQESRGISFSNIGGWSAVPWIAMCIGCFLSGSWSDKHVKRGGTKFTARAVLGTVGLIGCGVGLYMATTVTSIGQNIALLSISLGFLGFNMTAMWTASQDLGQQFGATTVSWMNFWGTVAGIIAPVLTAKMVDMVGWETAFAFSATVPLIGVTAWLFIKPDKSLINAAGELQ